jgi:septum formation protein
MMSIAEPKIYLASKSPRRRELLLQIGVQHELLLLRSTPPREPDISEEVCPGESPEDYVVRVTSEKASFAWKVMQMRNWVPRPVLAADTTVVVNGQIIGKPADKIEAAAMLRALSGRSHQVLTAIALQYHEQIWQTVQKSEVKFADLTDEMIDSYCASQEPYDKAGGYGIQGMAAVFIEHIAGSYSGIMGLPLYETAQLLRQANVL